MICFDFWIQYLESPTHTNTDSNVYFIPKSRLNISNYYFWYANSNNYQIWYSKVNKYVFKEKKILLSNVFIEFAIN